MRNCWPINLAQQSTIAARLRRDVRGNTYAMLAAAALPLMAIIGGGIDMGRSYLTETRLQQACDAGVLAARKRLANEPATANGLPTSAESAGQNFFALNFKTGAFGTEQLNFDLTLEADKSISGEATVQVPVTIMGIFGFDHLDLKTECTARMNFQNTDVMMVLDVTGSMLETNLGDDQPRIDELKTVIRTFHSDLTSSAQDTARMRFGFVPYSTNVNVAGLLEDEWMVDSWSYQTRTAVSGATAGGNYTYFTTSSPLSGSRQDFVVSTYTGTFNAMSGLYTCPTLPADTVVPSASIIGTVSETVIGPPAGTRTTDTIHRTRNGDDFSVTASGSTCTVKRTQYTNYLDVYRRITEPGVGSSSKWRYSKDAMDVSDWRTWTNGCIEERSTYEISDPANVDFSRALDLNIDAIPSANDPDTQWRPQRPWDVYARSMQWNGMGTFDNNAVVTDKEFVSAWRGGFYACSPPAKKLSEMDQSALESYLSTLTAHGSTYHDIGMIWGGRLLSPTGLFASENSDDVEGTPTSRHLIFLTDGQTSALDLNYSSYAMEPLDGRRWSPSSPRTLTETVEQRFSIACEEVKKKDITVWVIAFGTDMNAIMSQCAGTGHHFEAEDGEALAEAFAEISRTVGDLRISK